VHDSFLSPVRWRRAGASPVRLGRPVWCYSSPCGCRTATTVCAV